MALSRKLRYYLRRPPVRRQGEKRVLAPSALFSPAPELAAVAAVLAGIDRVHHLESDLTSAIPLVATRDAKVHARYLWGRRLPLALEVNLRSPRLGLAFLHELGHVIDHQVLGQGRFASIDRAPELAAWEAAAKATPIVSRHLYEPKWATYFGLTHERFARSYAQFLATRLGGDLRAQLERTRELGLGGFWADDAFAPIAAALQDLFATRAWLVTT